MISLLNGRQGNVIQGKEMVAEMNCWVRFMGLLCAALAVAILTSCAGDIDRQFGPSSLQGAGALPGRVITTSAPTGL
jgi:hypothetical protein